MPLPWVLLLARIQYTHYVHVLHGHFITQSQTMAHEKARGLEAARAHGYSASAN